MLSVDNILYKKNENIDFSFVFSLLTETETKVIKFDVRI